MHAEFVAEPGQLASPGLVAQDHIVTHATCTRPPCDTCNLHRPPCHTCNLHRPPCHTCNLPRPPCHTCNLHKTTLSHMQLTQHSKDRRQDGPGQDHHPFQSKLVYTPDTKITLAKDRSKNTFQPNLTNWSERYLGTKTSSCALSPGQSKGCLLESLTASNCWLEVHIKRQGQEAAWEPLHEAQVPDDLLAAFVQETHRTKAIPIPGESHFDMNPWCC